jgi:hypothetical protein
MTYGLGGFSTYPKGWGLDIAYINHAISKSTAQKIITQEIERSVKTGITTSFFIPAFLRRLKHVATYEWHFEKCRILFEYAHASFPQFKRYKNFQAFANECIGAVVGRSPMELEEIVRGKVSAFFTGNMEKVIESQSYLNQRHAEDVLKRVFIEMLGTEEGLSLFNKARNMNGDQPLSLNPDKFYRSFFVSERFVEMLRAWHWEKMQHWSKPEIIAQEIKTLRWPDRDKKTITKARSDTMRSLKTLRPALCELLYALQLPIFIATDKNANFFRYFYGTIPMTVMKDEEEMQEYTVFGLCMYQPHYRGGVIVTHGEKTKERFWHTLVEEISHLSDGPTDRGHGTGHHRYSGSREFEQALKADRAAITPWHRNNALGIKEWGQALTLLRINRFTRARLQKRIEAYDAALDFDHYARDERNAEIFAALPIVERALGKSLARRVMPNLYNYFDTIYLPGLRQEITEYK